MTNSNLPDQPRAPRISRRRATRRLRPSTRGIPLRPSSKTNQLDAPVFFISKDTATSSKIVEVLERRDVRCVTFTTAYDVTQHDELHRANAFVMDLRTPSVDDIPLFKIMRAGDPKTHRPFIFLVSQDSKLSARASGLSNIDQFLSMPVSASVLCETIHHSMVRHERRTQSVSVNQNVAMQGKISEITLPDIVQFMQVGRKTGFLHVESPRAKGMIAFVNGEIHHAEVGPIEGDEAFYLLMSMAEGDFMFEASITPPNRTIMTNITNLLLEGMRQLDEMKTLLDQFASRAAEVEAAKRRQREAVDDTGILEEI